MVQIDQFDVCDDGGEKADDELVRDISALFIKLDHPGTTFSPQSIEYCPDGSSYLVLISYSGKSTIKKHDATTHTVRKELERSPVLISYASYSQSGRFIVSLYEDGIAKIWNAKTYECIKILRSIPGLFVLGCDMRGLHPESSFSNLERTLLRQYGAILD